MNEENIKPHYLNHRQRLKNKFANSAISLADYEIIELLLGYAIPRRDVKPLAKELLSRFHSIQGILNAEIAELKSVKGIGEHVAILILLLKELTIRGEEAKLKMKEKINSPTDVLDFANAKLAGMKSEVMMVIFVNARNGVEHSEIIQKGTINKAVVFPREIIKLALEKNATGVIMIHNHPSGEPEPSAQDIRITGIIQKALSSVEITFLDHLIIGSNGYFSFQESELL